MAEAEVSLSSEQVQRLLQCAVCLDRLKSPKLLPCQHTFCLTPCLEGLIDHRTRSLRCPQCRADHFVPRGGPSHFPNNLTIIGFLALSEDVVRSGEDSPAAQQQSIPQRDSVEEIRPSGEIDDEGGDPTPRPQRHPVDRLARPDGGCSICHSDRMILRCCHCDCLVCNSCYEDHMEQARAALGRAIETIRRGLPHITDQIATVTRKGMQLQNRCETVKTEISEAVERHIRELRARERVLYDDVDTFFTRDNRILRNYQENAEIEVASLSSFCDSAESLLGGRRPVPNGDIVEMKRQSEEHVDTVRAYEDGTNRPPNVRHIQVSLESPFLSSTINNFGDLIIASRSSHVRLQAEDTDERHQPHVSLPRASLPPSEGESSQPQSTDPGQAAVRLPVPQSSSPASILSNSPHMSLPPGAEDRSQIDDNDQNMLGLAALAVPESRSASTSPITARRDREQSARPQQVTFSDAEISRWVALSQNIRSSRRSRQDRLSDTRISEETRGPTLRQRMRDRTRHRSLGALMAEGESSDDEESSRRDDTNTGNTASYSQPRRIRRSEARDITASYSFPGDTFGSAYLRPAQGGNREESEDVTSSVPSNYGSYMPCMYVNTPRNGYNQKGAAIKRIGERGSEAGQFIWPRGVAVSPLDDRIYVCDSSNHRVQIFHNDGRFIKWFGRYGQSEGEFDCLAGIAINGLGQVIIADRYNHRIQIFDRHGNFQKLFGSEGPSEGQLSYPWGVACDNMGFIYICDKENHRVQVFQSSGSFVRSFGSYGCRNGQFENPHYVAVSPDNKVYVSDSSNHRVQVFSIYGDFLFSFGGAGTLRGQMKFPRGISIDNQGFAVVADSGNNRIQVFRADGRYYSMFGGWGRHNGQFKGLEGLAIQANGQVIVSDRENHRIQIF